MPLPPKNSMPLYLLSFLKDLDLTVIDRFLESVSSQVSSESKSLDERMKTWLENAEDEEQEEIVQGAL